MVCYVTFTTVFFTTAISECIEVTLTTMIFNSISIAVSVRTEAALTTGIFTTAVLKCLIVESTDVACL